MAGRRQALEYARFLRDRVPGYEEAALVWLSSQIGVRETRRVYGDYRLTREDVLGARRFDDEVGLCGAPIEDHHAGADTRWQYLPDGEVVGIPYRTLVVRDAVDTLVAGRCFSATHDAHASVRSMAQTMAMGQAAGTAAAMAAAGGRRPARAWTLGAALRDAAAARWRRCSTSAEPARRPRRPGRGTPRASRATGGSASTSAARAPRRASSRRRRGRARAASCETGQRALRASSGRRLLAYADAAMAEHGRGRPARHRHRRARPRRAGLRRAQPARQGPGHRGLPDARAPRGIASACRSAASTTVPPRRSPSGASGPRAATRTSSA